MNNKPRIEKANNLSDYNKSVLLSVDILTGKEFRRLRRKNKKKV